MLHQDKRMMITLRRSKKAFDMPINIIVVAGIALLVLIIIIILFSSKIHVFNTGIRNCAAKGGDCEVTGCESNEVPVPDTNCENVCCLDIYDGGAKDDTN